MSVRSFAMLVASVLLMSSVVLGDIMPLPISRPRPRYRPQPVPPIVVPPGTISSPGPGVQQQQQQQYGKVGKTKSLTPITADIPVLDKDTQIKMQAADVAVHLSKGQTLGTVRAEVTCEFSMACSRAKNPTVSFVMGIPIFSGKTSSMKGAKCSVEIDGKKPEWLDRDTWSSSDGKITYHGYTWPTTIERGVAQKVKVKYSVSLPMKEDTAAFTYFLRSGASWQNPIGREKVRVTADNDVQVKAAPAKTISPVEKSDSEIVWDLKNFVPTENIDLVISLNK